MQTREAKEAGFRAMISSEEKKQLFLQLDRDIGTLIAMLGDCVLEDEDRQILIDIAARSDAATPKLQEILYPESIQKGGSKA